MMMEVKRTKKVLLLTVAKSSPGDGQIADIKILKSLASYLWIKDNLEFQFRVVAALFLLVGAK
ncbi:ABC transporter B family member mitochondrial-like, partial [Trifolium pratense]